MKHCLITLAGSALLMLCGGASAQGSTQVYKWVDAQGRTHYSESPPPEQKDKARKVDTSNIGKGVPMPAKPAAEQEGEFRKRQIERETRERKAEQEQKERERVKEQCVRVRQQLAVLNEQVPVYQRDEKGERKYMDDAQRQAEISRLQGLLRQHCD